MTESLFWNEVLAEAKKNGMFPRFSYSEKAYYGKSSRLTLKLNYARCFLKYDKNTTMKSKLSYLSDNRLFGYVKLKLSKEEIKEKRDHVLLQAEKLDGWIKTNDAKTKVEWDKLHIYGSEKQLEDLITSLPWVRESVKSVVLPSGTEAEKLLEEGYLFSANPGEFVVRIAVKAGTYNSEVLNRLQEMHDANVIVLSKSVKVKPGLRRYITGLTIEAKNEQQTLVLKMMDQRLCKKVNKICRDPGL